MLFLLLFLATYVWLAGLSVPVFLIAAMVEDQRSITNNRERWLRAQTVDRPVDSNPFRNGLAHEVPSYARRSLIRVRLAIAGGHSWLIATVCCLLAVVPVAIQEQLFSIAPWIVVLAYCALWLSGAVLVARTVPTLHSLAKATLTGRDIQTARYGVIHHVVGFLGFGLVTQSAAIACFFAAGMFIYFALAWAISIGRSASDLWSK